MGTVMISTKELAEAIDDALDALEGDFTNKQLQKVLKRAKFYPYVCDNQDRTIRNARSYNKLLSEL